MELWNDIRILSKIRTSTVLLVDCPGKPTGPFRDLSSHNTSLNTKSLQRTGTPTHPSTDYLSSLISRRSSGDEPGQLSITVRRVPDRSFSIHRYYNTSVSVSKPFTNSHPVPHFSPSGLTPSNKGIIFTYLGPESCKTMGLRGPE